MFKQLLKAQIARFEKRYDYDMSYAHRILRASRAAFLRFSLFSRVVQAREQVPAAPWFAARIVATLFEDCGPCTQLVVRMAEEAGVDSASLRSVVSGDETALSDEMRLAVRYARAVLLHTPDCEALHAEALQRWGERGVVSLALIIAYTRVFPTLKRALGYAHSCGRVEIGGCSVAPALFTARA